MANDFDWWNGRSLDAARLTEVVYYLSAGFLLLQAAARACSGSTQLIVAGAGIHAASGLAGAETWLSQTHSQNGNRLAAYGDVATA